MPTAGECCCAGEQMRWLKAGMNLLATQQLPWMSTVGNGGRRRFFMALRGCVREVPFCNALIRARTALSSGALYIPALVSRSDTRTSSDLPDHMHASAGFAVPTIGAPDRVPRAMHWRRHQEWRC